MPFLLLKNIQGMCVPTEALQITKKVTLNTKENRFLKFMLIRITEKVDSEYRSTIEVLSEFLMEV
jgi:predicted component of viral defense system (DUF524 family)